MLKYRRNQGPNKGNKRKAAVPRLVGGWSLEEIYLKLCLDGSVGKESICLQSIRCKRQLVPLLGQEDPLGGGNGNPLQYFCLGNPGAWRATVHGVTKESEVTKQLHTQAKQSKLQSSHPLLHT